MTLPEAFKILQISPTYDKKQLKKAYLKMVKIYHPDKMRDATSQEREQIIYRINDAYNFVLAKINGEDDDSLAKAGDSFKFNYQGFDNLQDDAYANKQNDIIDMLFSDHHQNNLGPDSQKIIISANEAQTGVTKRVKTEFNEIVTLEILPNTPDGHMIVQDGNCFEIKIK